jgi:hypothetical protein
LRRRSRNVCCPKYKCVKKTCYDETPCYLKYWDKYLSGELYPYCQNGYKQQVKERLDDCCVAYECVCDECPNQDEYEIQQANECKALENYYNFWYYWLYGEKQYECGLRKWTDSVDACGCKQPKNCECCTIGVDCPDLVCEIEHKGVTYEFSQNHDSEIVGTCVELATVTNGNLLNPTLKNIILSTKTGLVIPATTST